VTATSELVSRCFSCGREGAFDPRDTTCAACGGNQEILHDLPALRRILTREALARRGERSMWRYEELVPLAEGAARPGLIAGWTPLIPAPRLGEACGHRTLLLKDEGRNPSGSLKDRASAAALLGARAAGSPGIIGASTGNAGSSMACLAAEAGVGCSILVPADAPAAKIAQLLAFGARVIPVRGSYDQAFDLCLELSGRLGLYNRSTGVNPLTREGKKTCAFEICEQLDFVSPDWVFVSVGDGNIISGLHKGFTELLALGLIEKTPRLGAVQSSRSNAVAAAVARAGAAPGSPPSIEIEPVHASTRADSISVDLPRDGLAAARAVLESGGCAIEVDDEEILAHIPLVARTSGVFGEPAAVASVAGFAAAVERGLVRPAERAVCVITGNGLKDVASVTKVTGEPRRVPADPAVLEEIYGGG